MDLKLDTGQHTWDEDIASDWKWIVGPSRPSLSEQCVFDALCDQFPAGSRVLLLGSTPELRDLSYIHQFDTTVVDYNALTHRILQSNMRHPSLETLVVEDWRRMRFNQDFDIVLGDLALNMVPIPEQAIVLKNVQTALRTDGIFLHRVWISGVNEYRRLHSTIEEIVEEHRTHRSHQNWFSSIGLAMINYCLTPEDYSIDFHTILTELRNAFRRGVIPKECLDAFERPWKRYIMHNWLPTSHCIEKAMRQTGFEILWCRHGTEHYGELCPMYAVRREVS